MSSIPKDLEVLIRRKTSDPATSAREFVRLAELAEGDGAVETGRALRARANSMADPKEPTTAAYEPQENVEYVPEMQGQVESNEPLAVPTNAPADSTNSTNTRRGSKPQLGVVIPGVTAGAWKKFVQTMKVGSSSTVTPKGSIGMFGMKPRRLEDLGVLSDVRKGKRGRWHGKWMIDKEKFMTSPEAQYKLFARSMARYAKTVSHNFTKALGKDVNGQTVTLSGLLAVAHLSGEPGLQSWLSSVQIREKFPRTTNAFLKATGIF